MRDSIKPYSEVLCRGCSEWFDLDIGKYHVLSAKPGTKCFDFGRLDFFTLEMHVGVFKRVGPLQVFLDKCSVSMFQHTSAICKSIKVSTGDFFWREVEPLFWAPAQMIEIAELHYLDCDKGEVEYVLRTGRKNKAFLDMVTSALAKADSMQFSSKIDKHDLLVAQHRIIQKILKEGN